MARPPKEDRSTVASATLTIRLTPDERATLDALVDAVNEQVAETGARVTAAAFVRSLIRREGEARTPKRSRKR